jgi:hypothetical protein
MKPKLDATLWHFSHLDVSAPDKLTTPPPMRWHTNQFHFCLNYGHASMQASRLLPWSRNPIQGTFFDLL